MERTLFGRMPLEPGQLQALYLGTPIRVLRGRPRRRAADGGPGAHDLLRRIGTLENEIEPLAQTDPPAVVTVPDAALREVLEDSLGLSSGDPITEAALAKLTVLEAPHKGIVNLTGLEYATGLRRLGEGLRGR